MQQEQHYDGIRSRWILRCEDVIRWSNDFVPIHEASLVECVHFEQVAISSKIDNQLLVMRQRLDAYRGVLNEEAGGTMLRS